MPLIEVHLLAGRDRDQRAAFAADVTRAAQERLGAQPERVNIRFIDIRDDYMAIGGQLVADQQEPATASS